MPAPIQLTYYFGWLKNNLFSGLTRWVEVKLFIFIHPDSSAIYTEIHLRWSFIYYSSIFGYHEIWSYRSIYFVSILEESITAWATKGKIVFPIPCLWFFSSYSFISYLFHINSSLFCFLFFASTFQRSNFIFLLYKTQFLSFEKLGFSLN